MHRSGRRGLSTKPFNPILLRARIGASLEKKWLRDREKKFITDLQQEKTRSETLLLNILPRSIVDRMRNGEMVIADSVAEATILFCDLVFVMDDELEGDGVHDFELNLQLAPNRNAQLAATANGILCRIAGDPQLQLMIVGPAGIRGAVQPSSISATYGATVPAIKVRIWGRALVPARITTRISWVDSNSMTRNESKSADETKIGEAVAQGVSQS